MLQLRLIEHAAPTGVEDPDMLLGWMLDTLGLVRRRNDTGGEDAKQRALHRLLRDEFLANPSKGRDAKSLAKTLGISMTALHHHLKGLHSTRLITSTQGEEGWQLHFLRCGSLAGAIEVLAKEAVAILRLRLEEVAPFHTGKISFDAVDQAEALPLELVIRERGPQDGDGDAISVFLDDMGLRGKRAKSADDLARVLFDRLLEASRPLSLDEILADHNVTRPRLHRTFDRFRRAGLVERILRKDRMDSLLWDGLNAQHARRGVVWLTQKGGLSRLDEQVAGSVVKSLEEGKFDLARCEELFADVDLDQKMIALNLLGGRLPYGYRLTGENWSMVTLNVIQRVEDTFNRLAMVAQKLDGSES